MALRSFAGQIWFLDSLERSPRKLSQEDYVAYVNKHKAAYPIKFAENVGFASTSMSSLDDSPGGSPVLPVAASQAAHAEDSAMTTAPDEPDVASSSTVVPSGPLSLIVGDTSVPALMVAECHGQALSPLHNARTDWDGKICSGVCYCHMQARTTPWKLFRRISMIEPLNLKVSKTRHGRSTRLL